jgi:uncharacterized RDD family membrane protein YckC
MEQEKTHVITDAPVAVRYSGFWVRLAAHIIDGFVISMVAMIVLVPISVIFAFIGAFDHASFVSSMGQFVTTIASVLIGWSYHIILLQKFGATLGKVAVGVQVRSEDGTPLQTHAIIMRETVGKIVSAITLCVGYFMIAFTDKKQGLHDMIGKTVVVYKDPVKGPNVLVVWIVYIVHMLIVLAIAAIIAVLIFIVMFFVKLDSEGTHGGGYQEENHYYDENMDELKDVITDVIQES